jgi:hypothetical protein
MIKTVKAISIVFILAIFSAYAYAQVKVVVIPVGDSPDPKLAKLNMFGDSVVKAPVSDQTDKDFSAALAAAPKIPLFSKGQLTFYGKCFEHESFESYATVSVETSTPGAILGANDAVDPKPSSPGGPDPISTRTIWLDGDPDFLDPDTAENDRTIGVASKGAGSFQSADLVRVNFTAVSPDGMAINGLISMAVGSGGAYGSGSGCLFSGFVIG